VKINDIAGKLFHTLKALSIEKKTLHWYCWHWQICTTWCNTVNIKIINLHSFSHTNL